MNINFGLSSIIPILLISSCYSLGMMWFIFSIITTLIYFIIRFICKLLTFPGSYSLFFKYYSLYDYNKDILYNTIKKLKVFRQLDNRNSQAQIQEAKDYFTLQHQIFEQMKGQLNQQQQTYSNLLSNLMELLLSQQNQQLIQNQSNNIQRFFDCYLDKLLKINPIIRPFKSDVLFGTLEQFRHEILLTNPNASRHIIKYKNISIDCIHLANNRLNRPTVLFCNPNAAYYETLYKNCTWIKVYQDLKINIILWNYCEYGCSTGTATPTNLIESGIFVVQYFLTKFNIKTLGVHGSSLGGMVAQEIAYKLKLSFLIADRTFSSLGQVATALVLDLSIARFLFNCILNWDIPNYLSFCEFRGPKLIIQDQNDEIIAYKAQLQTGVVRQFFTNQTYSPLHSYFNLESKQYMDFFFSQILPKTETMRFSQSLKILIHSQNNQELYQDLKALLTQIEYCQNQFLAVMDTNPTPEKIALFFGSCFMFNQKIAKPIGKIRNDTRRPLEQHNSQFKERHEHVEIIVNCINKIAKNFSQTQQIQRLRQRRNQKYIDYLIAVNCGHNGNLDMKEEEEFKKYFLSKLIMGAQI